MKIVFVAVTAALAFVAADGRDFGHDAGKQVIAAEAKLFDVASEGQDGTRRVLSGFIHNEKLEDTPRERRHGKTLCRRKLAGRCVRRRKPCPGHLPEQTEPGSPYCSKFHRCCHQSQVTGCPSPWFTLLGQCFLHVVEKMTWSEARSNCTNQGADLAAPKNIKALADNLKGKGYGDPNNFWLGGSDASSEGDWVWLNGGGSITQGWTPGEPNSHNGDQDCLVMRPELGANSLDDYWCDRNLGFVCERDA